nr:pyridoxal 5'-phosphate synthase glutaminase subunit PdxT [Ardenticatenales bacterium]
TAIGKRAVEYGLLEPLREAGRAGFPIWGTCAGMVLLAETVGREQPLLELLPISIARNGFGRQVQSFETDLEVPVLGEPPFRAIFIRAPKAEYVGAGVEILAALPEGTPVALQRGALLATAFHPELTDDTRWHAYFITLIHQQREKVALSDGL